MDRVSGRQFLPSKGETWPVLQAMEQILQDSDADLAEQTVPEKVEPKWHSATGILSCM